MRIASTLATLALLATSAFAAAPTNDAYTFTPQNVLDIARLAYEPSAGIDSVVLSSGQVIRQSGHCGTPVLMALEEALRTTDLSPAMRQQIEELGRDGADDLDRTYNTRNFRIRFTTDEDDDDCVYMPNDVDRNTPDEDGNPTPWYIVELGQALERALSAYSDFRFREPDADDRRDIEVWDLENNWFDRLLGRPAAWGRTAHNHSIEIDNNMSQEPGSDLTDLFMRDVAAHELFHKVQFEYFDYILNYPVEGVFSEGWFMEGTADWGTDMADDDLNGYILTANQLLDDPGIDLRNADYTASLWWRFVCEQFGGERDEPGVGADFMRAAFEAIDENGGDGVEMIDEILQAEGNVDFETAFARFFVANYVKSLPNPAQEYNYLEKDDFFYQNHEGLRYHEVAIQHEYTLDQDHPEFDYHSDRNPLQPWSAQYFEINLEEENASVRITLSGDEDGEFIWQALAIDGNENLIQIYRSEETEAEFEINDENLAKVVVVAGAYGEGGGFEVEVRTASRDLFTRHEIDRFEDWKGAWWGASTADLDLDGDVDLLVGTYKELNGSRSDIYWYENTDEHQFRRHIVDDDPAGFVFGKVNATDLDRDGDLDLIVGTQSHNVWYENDGRQQFTSHIINDIGSDFSDIIAIDLDNDGDLDLAGGLWCQNDGQQNFDRIIENVFGYPVDIDNDGDLDGVSGMSIFENNGEMEFQRIVIDDNPGGHNYGHPKPFDLDEDGDLDFVVGTEAQNLNQVLFYENDGRLNFERHVIDNNPGGYIRGCINAADIDGDGDLDLTVGTYEGNQVLWYENIAQGQFTEHLIENPGGWVWGGVSIADLDGDNDFDLIAGTNRSGGLFWYENNSRDHLLESLKLLRGVDARPSPIFASLDPNFSASFSVQNVGGEPLRDITLVSTVSNAQGNRLFDLEEVHFDAVEPRESVDYGPIEGTLETPGTYLIRARAFVGGHEVELEIDDEATNPVRVRVEYGLVHFEPPANTGDNHSVVVTGATLGEEALDVGNEIAVFTPAGICAGAGVWNGDQAGFAVWGDDDQTEEVEGFRAGEELSFRIWEYNLRSEFTATPRYSRGDGEYQIDGISVCALSAELVFEQRISLAEGWNMISSNIETESVDMRVLFSEIVERGHLTIMKDYVGRFYVPSRDFNGIPRWQFAEGYQVKMSSADVLTMRGERIPYDKPIELQQGWQMIAYYPTWQLDVRDAFDNVVENLTMVKDNLGRFYFPEFGFSNLGNLSAGQGYRVNMEAADELIYPRPEQRNAVAEPVDKLPTHFISSNSGANMSVLIQLGITNDELGISEGEIGVFTVSGLCVGSTGISAGQTAAEGGATVGIAVWADDPTTPEIDGAVEGEALSFRVWDGASETLVRLTAVDRTEILFETDGFAFVTLDVGARHAVPRPSEFALYSAFPNPFNSSTSIQFGLPFQSEVSLKIIDIYGREVANLVDLDVYPPGYHSLTFEAGNLSSGVYFVAGQFGKAHLVSKVMLIR